MFEPEAQNYYGDTYERQKGSAGCDMVAAGRQLYRPRRPRLCRTRDDADASSQPADVRRYSFGIRCGLSGVPDAGRGGHLTGSVHASFWLSHRSFWALLTGLTGLFTGVAILVFVRFAFGVSEGLSNPAIYKLVGDTFDERERAQAVAWWATAIAAAPALSGPLVGTLLTSFGWKTVFVMLAAPAIAIAVLNSVLLPKKAEVERAVGTTDEVRIPFRNLLQQPAPLVDQRCLLLLERCVLGPAPAGCPAYLSLWSDTSI